MFKTSSKSMDLFKNSKLETKESSKIKGGATTTEYIIVFS